MSRATSKLTLILCGVGDGVMGGRQGGAEATYKALLGPGDFVSTIAPHGQHARDASCCIIREIQTNGAYSASRRSHVNRSGSSPLTTVVDGVQKPVRHRFPRAAAG
ncbi:hypothetical protein DFH06DRAFT_1127937 [Mycena polygramma]|nr:hypothetical protein DFH06DRAFT_1127937 [Mycena polygramma]